MARTIALIHTVAPAHLLPDLPRRLIVLGCAAALILAGHPLPF
ncbi:MAG: hypothetical protein Q8R81_04605 [Novosphingobium sp.]|nr:hypothetical protein [Novosphingobium sp.]MDP3549658.1 hypothetical protein [Novosphingobium sp.]